MLKHLKWGVLVGLLMGSQAIANPTRSSHQQIIFHTNLGDFVIALFPDLAPKHADQIFRLVKLGVFESMYFGRIIPDKKITLAHQDLRLTYLNDEQRQAIHPLKPELRQFGLEARMITMAPHSSLVNYNEVAFTVHLSDEPLLSGKVTIVGELSDGLDVITAISKLPRGLYNEPLVKPVIRSAEIVTRGSFTPKPFQQEEYNRLIASTKIKEFPKNFKAVLFGLAGMILIALITFVLCHRSSHRNLAAICLMIALISGFLLYAHLIPFSRHHSWIAITILLGSTGLFRLMTRFEST